jgi:hypothetical protein
MSEFGRHINGLGVVIRGVTALREVEHVTEIALHSITTLLGRNTHVAVRATTPSVVPLAGSHAGASIQINVIHPPTLRGGPGYAVVNEREYLSPSDQWHRPVRLSGVSAHFMGWLHPQLNVVLEIDFEHRMDEETRSREDIIDEQRIEWCKESLFILAPSEVCSLPTVAGGPPVDPSISVAWPDGRLLLAWLHPSLVGPFFSLGIEPDISVPDQERFSLFREETASFHSLCESAATWCAGVTEAEVVAPDRAVHMFAAIGHHLVPRSSFMVYRTVDLMRGDLPSPISTARRQLRFTVCWWLPEQVRRPGEALSHIVGESRAPNIRYDIDEPVERLGGSYLVCRILEPAGGAVNDTGSIVEAFEPKLRAHIAWIEVLLSRAGFVSIRETRMYWAEEYYIDFV